MTHASLFSGIGGPEVAAAMMGWENAFHCEINPFGRAVLEYWFPNSKSYEDITKTDFTEWRGKVDVLTGGFPCQPFSYAGKRGGREDERYLWPEMLRVIDEVRPTWVVGENVAGITTMVEGGVLTPMGSDATLFGEGDGLRDRWELRQSFTIERICRDLEGLGYSVQPVLIPAAAVGAPHRRDRVFICAHRDSDDLDRRVSKREVSGTEESESVGYGSRLQYREGHDIRRASPDSACGGHPAQKTDGGIDGNGDGQVPLKSERREQTKRADGLSSVQGTTQDTVGDGCRLGADGEQRGVGVLRDAGAGDDERICGEEGIPASHSLSEGTRSISGSSCDKGRESGEDWGEGIRQAHGTSGSSGAVAAGLHASDPNRGRGGEVSSEIHSGKSDGNESVSDGSERNATHANSAGLQEEGPELQAAGNRRGGEETIADTYSEGREESQQPGRGEDCEEDGAGMDDRAERFGRYGVFADPELLPENRWRNFPTVSPVHAGNDGLPVPMDGASIPFNKWRTESLKAYGNAIVPQVMYRIFQAIEETERQ